MKDFTIKKRFDGAINERHRKIASGKNVFNNKELLMKTKLQRANIKFLENKRANKAIFISMKG